MAEHTITINVDKKCPRCGKKGVPCLACVLKDMEAGKFDHIIEKHRKNRTMGEMSKLPWSNSTKPGGGE